MNNLLEKDRYYCKPDIFKRLIGGIKERIALQKCISDITIDSLKMAELTQGAYDQKSDARLYSCPIVEVKLHDGSLFIHDKRHATDTPPIIIEPTSDNSGYRINYGMQQFDEKEIPRILRQFIFDIDNPEYPPQVYISF